MIVGTTMNAVITPVHTLVLAYNRVRLILYSHTVACLLMVPLTLLLVKLYGVKGGAMSIAILYAGYFFIQVILIFKSIGMQKLVFNWYIKDVLQFWLPVSTVIFLATHYWLGIPDEWTRTNLLIKLSAIGLVGCLVSLLCNNSLRQKLMSKLISK